MQTKPQGDIGELIRDTRLITEALTRAAREALLEDKRLGVPVPVWRNGQTEWVPPEQIDMLLAQIEVPPARR